MTQPTHDRKIRYAVIGCGQISLQSFIPGLERAANSTLAALVTGDMHKGRPLKPAMACGSGIMMTCRTFWHRAKLMPCIWQRQMRCTGAMPCPCWRRGCTCFWKNPWPQAWKTARRSCRPGAGGGRLMIAYRLHCEPGTVELVSRCRNGDFGAPVGFSSVFGQDVPQSNHRAHGGYWSGPVPDLGNYPINAVRHMFGAEPVEVTATGTRTPGRTFNFDDTVSVVLRFADGRIADFMVSYACAPVEGLDPVWQPGQCQGHALLYLRPVRRHYLHHAD